MLVCLSDPGDVVYSHNRGGDLLSSYPFNSLDVSKGVRKKSLSSEYLVTASVSADLGEFAVESAYRYSHRIGEIENESIGAVFSYVCRDLSHHRNCSESTYKSSGACCVAYRLINAVFFGSVNVALHFVKGSGKDRDDNEVCSFESILKLGNCLVAPFFSGEGVADFLVVFSSLFFNVVEVDRSRHFLCLGEIVHKNPRPRTGAASDICYFYVFCFAVLPVQYIGFYKTGVYTTNVYLFTVIIR